ncbi:MAG: DNA polymerase III subunit beta [Lachnospiraceae bacterium]|nr:DNA polymerase III subunit beta [Lachnospiraceae bacterium]MBR5788551.1 DNA polymerase III subunit beta [Lachnospiraceae bacterium]
MKIRCSKTNLLNGVNIVLKAVPQRTSMAILECILIDASGDEIKLTANNMELGIETIIEGDILERGIIALDARIFSDIVRKLPDNDVVINVESDMKTTIECEKARFNIIGKSGEDFPYLPMIERNNKITISQFTLREVIRQTIFAINENDSNKMMGCELLRVHENELLVVSLDGHRVAIRKIKLNNNYPDKDLIVPGKTLQEIIKIINGGQEDDVNIYYTNNHIVFEFERTTVVSRLVEGEFFKISTMLSADYKTKVSINKRELLSGIDRSTVFAKEGDKKPIRMNIVDNTLEIKMDSFTGSMKEEIDIVKEGEDLMIGFNSKFFIDALRVIDDEEVTLYMVNPKAPCFIKDKEESYIYLILPINFNSAQ